MRVSKKLGRYVAIGLLVIMLIVPIFTTGENDTNPVDNLIVQEEETIENIEEPIEIEEPITPAATASPTPLPTPEPTPVPLSNWGLFKSYEHYTSITCRGTLEYEIARNHSETCGVTGIRIVLEDDRIYYCIAIGTGWGFSVGDKLVVTLSGGKQFYAIMTDTKANKHTKNDNKTMKSDGSVIEFVVGKPKEVRKYSWYYHGTLGVLEQFNGGIVSIDKI